MGINLIINDPKCKYADVAGSAVRANYANRAGSASYADSANYANSAGSADYASSCYSAVTAASAYAAYWCSWAISASQASFATSCSYAWSATSASTCSSASRASTCDVASSVISTGPISISFAGITDFAIVSAFYSGMIGTSPGGIAGMFTVPPSYSMQMMPFGFTKSDCFNSYTNYVTSYGSYRIMSIGLSYTKPYPGDPAPTYRSTLYEYWWTTSPRFGGRLYSFGKLEPSGLIYNGASPTETPIGSDPVYGDHYMKGIPSILDINNVKNSIVNNEDKILRIIKDHISEDKSNIELKYTKKYFKADGNDSSTIYFETKKNKVLWFINEEPFEITTKKGISSITLKTKEQQYFVICILNEDQNTYVGHTEFLAI